MKKRLFSFLLSLIMLMPMFLCFSAEAKDDYQWIYTLTVKIRDKHEAGTKSNSVNGYVHFVDSKNNEKLTFRVNNNKQIYRGKTYKVEVQSNTAPWLMSKVEMKNGSNDSVCIEHISLTVRRYGASESNNINFLDKYNPNSNNTIWIETQKNKTPSFSVSVSGAAKRMITGFDDLDNLNKTIHVNVKSDYSQVDPYRARWSGKISDNYMRNYNVYEFSTPPTMSFSIEKDSVVALDSKLDVGWNTLIKSGIITEVKDEDGNKYGFDIDYHKLSVYMNENAINKIPITTTITFPTNGLNLYYPHYIRLGGDSNGKVVKTLVIERRAFALSDIKYSNTSLKADDNNFYYGQSSNTVKFTAKISTGGNNNHITLSDLKGKTISFSEAKIQVGSSQTYINAKKIKNVAINDSGYFTLEFDLGGEYDSLDVGTHISLFGGEISIGDQGYYLCLEGKQAYGNNLVPGYYTEYQVGAMYKIDTVLPTVSVIPQNEAVNGWRKNISLKITPSENISSASGDNTLQYQFASLNEDGSIKKLYPISPQSGSGLDRDYATTQPASGAGGATANVTVALKNTEEVEGIIIVKGIDIAGNPLNTILRDVKLDNLAPRVTVSVRNDTQSDYAGYMSSVFSFEISDASGTGRVYYCFSTSPIAPALPDVNDVQVNTGTLTTTLGRWAFIKQSNNNIDGTALLQCAPGVNFSGYLHYYSVDDFGNATGIIRNTVNINNEKTDCKINILNATLGRNLPDYEISITSNANNTIYWRWLHPTKSGYINDYKLYSSASEVGSGRQIDSNGDVVILNGECTLEVMIVTPSNSRATTKQTVVFDNGTPDVSISFSAPESFRDSHTVRIKASDDSGIAEAYACILNSDGSELPSYMEFPLRGNGYINESIILSGLPSGEYILQVRAVDGNGHTATVKSDVFYIRSAAPEVTLAVPSDNVKDDMPLISSQDYTVNITASEAFANANSQTAGQVFCYRISDTASFSGDWTGAPGFMTVSENSYTLADGRGISVNSPIVLVDGINTIYVQSVILSSSEGSGNINMLTVATSVIEVYFDETPPLYRLELSDIHTSDSITGTLTVSDNIENAVYCTSDSDAVTITETDIKGVFVVTVTESIKTDIRITDGAGNVTLVPISIKNIDRTAPELELTAPVAVTAGERVNYTATLKITAKNVSTPSFALIPADKLSTALLADGVTINPDFFYDYDSRHFSATLSKETASHYSDEVDCVYAINLTALNGNYYLGVYTEDSVGNGVYRIFDRNVFSPVDATVKQPTISVSPERAGTKTVLTAEFNVPVAVLPFNKILTAPYADMTDEEAAVAKAEAAEAGFSEVEWANFEEIDRLSIGLAQKVSFVITAHGTYRFYTLDEVGRMQFFDVTIGEEHVTFGNSAELDADVYIHASTEKYEYTWVERLDKNGNFIELIEEIYDNSPDITEEFVKLEDGKWATHSMTLGGDSSVFDVTEVVDGEYIIRTTINTVVTSSGYSRVVVSSKNGEKYLMGSKEVVDGLRFNETRSKEYAVYDSENNIIAYTKLVYDVQPITDFSDDPQYPYGWYYVDQNERQLFVKYKLNPNDDVWQDAILLVDNIDNTPPESVTDIYPTISQDDNRVPIVFTLGNVVANVVVSDPHSGIAGISLYISSSFDESSDYVYFDVIFPERTYDELGNPNDYLDAETLKIYEYSNEYLLLTVHDILGSDTSKHIQITFYDNVMLGLSTINGAGSENNVSADDTLESFLVENIYKKDLSEDDYILEYHYLNPQGGWTPLPADPTEAASIYYRNVKAVIVPTEEGLARGIAVSNNGESLEKVLDSYASSFTFELIDKYGYSLNVPVSASNFDMTPGTVSHTVSTTEKTNRDITVTITASDSESGIGSVTLTKGAHTVSLIDNGNGVFTGQLSENGNYAITLIDNSGNKTVKSFSVANINKVLPEITAVEYSFPQQPGATTAKDITVRLKYSKANVTLTRVYAASTSSDFSADLSSSVIRFGQNMTVTVEFKDDYGNTNVAMIPVTNIYKTPPALVAVPVVASNKMTVGVTFAKALNSETGVPVDTARELSDITVSYRGVAQRADTALYTFAENGSYTFMIYDDDGISSYVTATITGIDKTAPVVTQIRWSYEYDLLENGEWKENLKADGSFETGDEAGYVVATDTYPVTNKDVTVTVVTDGNTSILGSGGEYQTEHTLNYDKNGLYIFNLEKENGLKTSYGVDIELIDKTPPVIELVAPELVFFENPSANAVQYSRDMIDKGFTAYDMFGGRKELNDRVTIDYGSFNPDDLSANVYDRSSPYTITYTVYDDAHNKTEVRMTIRLVSYFDTIVLVNDVFPDYAGRVQTNDDVITLALKNFSGIAYARISSGVKTLGEMKKVSTVLSKSGADSFEFTPEADGWYTILIQTDKRDYFNIQVYVYS